MGLSTQALKPNSLDPDSMWCRVRSTRHANYSYCTAGLDLTHSCTLPEHCQAAQHAAYDPDQGRVEAKWSLGSDRIRIQGPVWRAPMLSNVIFPIP